MSLRPSHSPAPAPYSSDNCLQKDKNQQPNETNEKSNNEKINSFSLRLRFFCLEDLNRIFDSDQGRLAGPRAGLHYDLLNHVPTPCHAGRARAAAAGVAFMPARSSESDCATVTVPAST
jgi:hypothetical protein